jgi:hypothetical protein
VSETTNSRDLHDDHISHEQGRYQRGVGLIELSKDDSNRGDYNYKSDSLYFDIKAKSAVSYRIIERAQGEHHANSSTANFGGNTGDSDIATVLRIILAQS